jgi:hypothetical protein
MAAAPPLFPVRASFPGEEHRAPIEASGVLPEQDLVELARFALMKDQHAALRAFRDALRR